MSRADEPSLLLPADQEAEVLAALEAAWRPTELSPVVNERLIERALEDPFAPATEEERAEAARLREALDQEGTAHEDAAALAALRAAFAASDDPRVQHQVGAAVDQALAARPRRGSVVYAVFGAASAVVAAAAVALLLTGAPSPETLEPTPVSQLAKPRSTVSLFSERFETADTTARMDAIASARGRELRDNRYAAWGVR